MWAATRAPVFDAVKDQICRVMLEVLESADNDSMLLIENNAGQGNGIGSTFAEVGELIRGCDHHPRIGVCLDTCHAFAMGYEITTREGCELAMAEFDREIGFDRLRAVHANDSKMPLGGVRDRHENIGDGHMGLDGFRNILGHAAFRDAPLLLEVPGIEGGGPDEENVNRLKRIREEVGAPGPDALVSSGEAHARRLEGALLEECAEWIWEQIQEEGLFVPGELIELILTTERELDLHARPLPEIATGVAAAFREQSHLLSPTDERAIESVLAWEDEFLGIAGIPRESS